MALYFGKPRRWPPKKPIQFLLAFGALLLAIAIMVSWMLITHRQANPPVGDPTSSDSSQYSEPLTTINHCLLVLDFSEFKRFVLIQTNPADDTITAMAIPANCADKNGVTITELLNKHGSLRVIQSVSAILELPIEHYITFTETGAQSFLSELDAGIAYTLPEDIQYTDENGATIRLSAGEHKLTGAQASSVLKYSGWNNSATAETMTAEMTAAILNQYLCSERSFSGYFAALSNVAQTDLRIDNFNAFRPILTHLASHNTGTICRTVTLIGKIENDVFIPNIEAMRKETELYH